MFKKILFGLIFCALIISAYIFLNQPEDIYSVEQLIGISNYSEKEAVFKTENNSSEDSKIINNYLKEIDFGNFSNIKIDYKEQEFNFSNIKNYIKKNGNYLMVLQTNGIKEIKEKEHVKNNILRFDSFEVIDDKYIKVNPVRGGYFEELYPYKWYGGFEKGNYEKEYAAQYLLEENNCINNIDKNNNVFAFIKKTDKEVVSLKNTLREEYYGVVANLYTEGRKISTKDIDVECLKKTDFIYQFVEAYEKPEILIFNHQVIDYDENFSDLNIIDNDTITFSNDGRNINTSVMTRHDNRFILWNKQSDKRKVVMDWGVILPSYPDRDDKRFHDEKYDNYYYKDDSNKGYAWLKKKYDETYIKYNDKLKKNSNISHPALKDYFSFWFSRNFNLEFDKYGNYWFIDTKPKDCETKLTKYQTFDGDYVGRHYDEFCENIESFVLKSPKNKKYKNKVFEGMITNLKVSPNGKYILFIWKDKVLINGEYFIDENYENINDINFSSENEELSFYAEKNNKKFLVTISLNNIK